MAAAGTVVPLPGATRTLAQSSAPSPNAPTSWSAVHVVATHCASSPCTRCDVHRHLVSAAGSPDAASGHSSLIVCADAFAHVVVHCAMGLASRADRVSHECWSSVVASVNAAGHRCWLHVCSCAWTFAFVHMQLVIPASSSAATPHSAPTSIVLPQSTRHCAAADAAGACAATAPRSVKREESNKTEGECMSNAKEKVAQGRTANSPQAHAHIYQTHWQCRRAMGGR